MFLSEKASVPAKTPSKSRKREKYSNIGVFSKETFREYNLPREISEVLANSANRAISENTKSVYSTAVNMLENCASDLKVDLSFPLDEKKILTFIGWNLLKGLKADSIRSYLSGLKKAQKAKGFKELNTNSPLIDEILEGHKKVKKPKNKNQKKRLPCTLNTLRWLKSEIKMSNLPNSEKILMWGACTIGFLDHLG